MKIKRQVADLQVAKKTAKIEVSIEPSIKEQFMRSLSVDGKSASVEIGNWIREYLKNHQEANK